MQRLTLTNGVDTPPPKPAGLQVGKFPASGANASAMGAYFFHMITEELRNFIVQGGLTPNEDLFNQMATVLENLTTAIAQGSAKADSALLGYPYGGLLPWPGTTPPRGFIKSNGILLPRSGGGSFPKLTEAVTRAIAGTDTSLLVVTDANWANNPGAFSSGDGVTNYRVPDFRSMILKGTDDGSGVRSTQTGRAVGTYQLDAVKSHGHGVPRGTSEGDNWATTTNGGGWDGNNVPTTVDGGAENLVRNMSVLWCIRAYEVTA